MCMYKRDLNLYKLGVALVSKDDLETKSDSQFLSLVSKIKYFTRKGVCRELNIEKL